MTILLSVLCLNTSKRGNGGFPQRADKSCQFVGIKNKKAIDHEQIINRLLGPV